MQMRVGPMLARLGVEQENSIALVLLDTVDFPILFWGAIRAGVMPVLMNTRLTVDQYRYLLEDSRARVAFVSPALLPVRGSGHRHSDTCARSSSSAAPAGSPALRPALLAEKQGARRRAPASTTSPTGSIPPGTTGMLKGVMHAWRPRFMAQSAGVGTDRLSRDDVVFSAAKLFSLYGIGSALICPNWVGATTVLYPERPTPRTVFRRCAPSIRHCSSPCRRSMRRSSRTRLPAGDGLAKMAAVSSRLANPARACRRSLEAAFGIDIVNGVGSSGVAISS